MSNYVFLKQESYNNPDGAITVVDASSIQDTRLSDIYNNYGQKTGHNDAGSVICLLNEEAVQAAQKWAEENDVKTLFKVQDNIIAYEESDLFDYLLENCTEDVDIDVEVPTVEAINYHDGRNWQSIPLNGEEYGVTVEYQRITDEEEIEKLTAIIEDMQYVSEGYGVKRFRSGNHAVSQSAFATDFALYSIELDAYDEEVEINTSTVDAIILDNKYTYEDIENDFDSHPEGWNCVLMNEMTYDQMTDEQRDSFRTQLFDYAKTNAFDDEEE